MRYRLCASVMMRRLQDFSGGWIVSGQQRQRAQVAEEIGEPEAANGNRNDDIGDCDIERLREIRLDDPEKIHEAHQNQPNGKPYQLADVALERARKQKGERYDEVAKREDQRDPTPAAVKTIEIESDFRRQVAGPDDEPLRKAEVGPHHDESEHPLAMVVDEVGLKHVRHRLVVVKNPLDDYGETHGGKHFADEDDQAEDGRDPTGIERHDPVDGSESDGEAVEDESRAGDCFEFLRVVGSIGAITLLRPHRKQKREEIPDQEINNGANDEAGWIQIRSLDETVLLEVLANVRVLNCVQGHQPRIDAMLQHGNDDRDKEEGEARQGAHGGALDAANDDAPSTTGQVANHDNRHGTERNSQPAHESEQVSAEKLVGTRDSEDHGGDSEHDANHQRPLGDPADDRRSRKIDLVRSLRAHFDSSFISSDFASGTTMGCVAPDPGSRNFGGSEGIFCPGGMSDMVAFWLNCSARTYAMMFHRSRVGICDA